MAKRILNWWDIEGVSVLTKKEVIIKDVIGVFRKFNGVYTAFNVSENEVMLGGITIKTSQFLRHFKITKSC